MIVHYQRLDGILQSGCGRYLSSTMDWSINENEVTCKQCIVYLKQIKNRMENKNENTKG